MRWQVTPDENGLHGWQLLKGNRIGVATKQGEAAGLSVDRPLQWIAIPSGIEKQPIGACCPAKLAAYFGLKGNHDSKELTAMNNSKSKTFSLGDLWQERLSVHYPGEFQKPLTQKDRGQLKGLADKVGAETREVIIYAVANWIELCHEVRSLAGVPCYPTRPKIGFLLAYCDVAVNLRRQAMARERAKAEADKARAELEARKAKTVQPAKLEDVPMTPEQKAAVREAYLSCRACPQLSQIVTAAA